MGGVFCFFWKRDTRRPPGGPGGPPRVPLPKKTKHAGPTVSPPEMLCPVTQTRTAYPDTPLPRHARPTQTLTAGHPDKHPGTIYQYLFKVNRTLIYVNC